MKKSIRMSIMTHCKYMVILFCFLSICFSNSLVNAAEKLEPVILQLKYLHAFQFAGYYAAKAKGYYAEEGLDIIILERDPKKRPAQTVLEGAAQYGVSDAGLLLEQAQGKQVVLLKQIFQHSPLVFLSLKSSGIISPDKFIGKKIMFDTAGGDAPLQAMLANTLGGVEKIIPVPYSYNYEDLITGKTDVLAAYLTDQPYYYKQRGVAVNIIDPKSYGIDFYGDNLFTTEDEIQNHPERVDKMIRATLRGWDYALKHQAEVVDIIIRKYNSKLNRKKLLFEAKMTEMMILPEIIPLGFVTPYRYERIAQFYKRVGLVKSLIDPCDLIYKCSQFTGKKDLPFTPEEKAWLENLDGPLLVANETDWPPFDFAKNGEPKGFSIDLIKLAAQKAGIKLNFINGFKWDELLEKFKRKELDILPAVADIPERHDFMSFTSPYITNPSVLVVHDKSTELNTIDDLEGKRVAVIDGYATATIIEEHYPGIQPVRVNSVLAGLKSVSLGKTDAYVGTFGTISHMLKVNFIPNIKISNESLMEHFKESRLCFGVARERTLLQGILQKGMDAVSPDEFQELRQRWLATTVSTSEKDITFGFSVAEKKWLDKHPKIRLGIDPSWPPFEFTDPDGNYSGISSGIVDELFEIMEKLVPKDKGKAIEEDTGADRTSKSDEMPALDGVNTLKGIRTWRNAAVYQKALLEFSYDYENAAEKILNLIENGNREKAIHIIHTLKGVSGNLAIMEVHAISEALDTGVRQNRDGGTEPLIESLANALSIAITSIRQLDIETEAETTEYEKETMDLSVLRELFRGMLASFDKYNPKAVEPFVEELNRFFEPRKVDPIKRRAERFDFNDAKNEMVKLALAVGIAEEELHG
ncbi:ABC transporter substrate-binding protein [Desulfococcaceae bacterium HSG7]|nr:ABC transporter substrate-binding protein [Desulfococcaceae bacterium HSG7]